MAKNYQDCELKEKVLTALLKTPSISAQRLHTSIDYYGTIFQLRSYLIGIKNRGLVSRRKIDGLFRYSLTNKGIIQQRKPYETLRKRQRWLENTRTKAAEIAEAMFHEFKSNDEEFMLEVERYAKDVFSHPIKNVVTVVRPKVIIKKFKGSESTKPIYNDAEIDEDGDEADNTNTIDAREVMRDENYLETIKDLQDRLYEAQKDAATARIVAEQKEEELRNANYQLMQKGSPARAAKQATAPAGVQYIPSSGVAVIDTRTGKVLSPEKQQEVQKKIMNRAQRAEYRKNLVKSYAGALLDMRFFVNWGYVYPRWIKGKSILGKKSIEIMTDGNKEISRGHTKGLLRPDEFVVARFRIIKATNAGVEIHGQGMRMSQRLMF